MAETASEKDKRATIFITHAAPEDNEFALWLSSKLVLAGYRVWIDRRRLRGGNDTWTEIDRVLRNQTVKQIVVYGTHIGKAGVKKELAIGEVMSKMLGDEQFMIPVRKDDVPFGDAPPEILRAHMPNAYPDWHACLEELFETLSDAGVPKSPTEAATALNRLIEARQDGRRFITDKPEELLTNWFPVNAAGEIRYFKLSGTEDQKKVWFDDCALPKLKMGQLVGMLATLEEAEHSSSLKLSLTKEYEIPLDDFISGIQLGPYLDKKDARRDVSNLLRQVFEQKAAARGLRPIEFANKEIGWAFPDKLISGDKIECLTPDGRTIKRVMSGKFKDLRWHACIVAKPRLLPMLGFRIHLNVVLSEDGQNFLPGDVTHKKRVRLTRSWWNNIWRDRLLTAVSFLGEGKDVEMGTAGNKLSMSAKPISVTVDTAYDDTDPPMPTEENEDGEISPSAALEEYFDELDDAEDLAA